MVRKAEGGQEEVEDKREWTIRGIVGGGGWKEGGKGGDIEEGGVEGLKERTGGEVRRKWEQGISNLFKGMGVRVEMRF